MSANASTSSTSSASSSSSPSSSSPRPSPPHHQYASSRLHPLHLKFNVDQITVIRTLTSLSGGMCAGILGLTNFSGFVFYMLTALLTSIFIHFHLPSSTSPSMTMSSTSTTPTPTPTPYFPSHRSLWTDGWMGALMTYVLTWTLLYDIVYIY